METWFQQKQEDQLAALFAKVEETDRQEQFYQQQSTKLHQQAAPCHEQNEKLVELGEKLQQHIDDQGSASKLQVQGAQ